ncbi:hypothetical protein RYX36_029103, partial [Vicia faba]
VPYPFMTMVRGKQVSFSNDAINEYLGNPLTLEDSELCQYAKRLARGYWKFELVKDALVLTCKTYETNTAGHPKKFFRQNLRTTASVLMTLVLYSIMPRSHTSFIPMDTSCLLSYILDDRKVDVARVIAYEIKMITENGHRLACHARYYCNNASTVVIPICRRLNDLAVQSGIFKA